VNWAINPFARTFLVKLRAASATVLGVHSNVTSAVLSAEAAGGTAFSPLSPVGNRAVGGADVGIALVRLALCCWACSASTSGFRHDDEIACAGTAAALFGAVGPLAVFEFTVDGHHGGISRRL